MPEPYESVDPQGEQKDSRGGMRPGLCGFDGDWRRCRRSRQHPWRELTPDLMPVDLIGTNVVLEAPEGKKEFEFQLGPLFANVRLADEINCATPKTRSALLEAMQQHSVTAAGQTYKLPEPFFVLATQNPLEMEGIYRLPPEAQLDRFLCKLLVKFPNMSDIENILDRTTESEQRKAEPTLSGERILEISRLARQILIADEVRRYGIALVLATNPDNELATDMTRRFLRYGWSPCGAQAIILAAKIRAILDRHFHVAREDLQAVAHRDAASADSEFRGPGRRNHRQLGDRKHPRYRGSARRGVIGSGARWRPSGAVADRRWPPQPRRSIPRDLQTVCLKCLERLRSGSGRLQMLATYIPQVNVTSWAMILN